MPVYNRLRISKVDRCLGFNYLIIFKAFDQIPQPHGISACLMDDRTEGPHTLGHLN